MEQDFIDSRQKREVKDQKIVKRCSRILQLVSITQISPQNIDKVILTLYLKT